MGVVPTKRLETKVQGCHKHNTTMLKRLDLDSSEYVNGRLILVRWP